MLTKKDLYIISSHIVEGPEEQYPERPAYIFKGRGAFDLHLKLVHLVDNFEESYTEKDKRQCLLLVTIQTTVSKAALKNPNAAPLIPNRHINLYFYSRNGQPMVSSRIKPSKKKWALRILDAEPGNLIGYL